MGAPRSATLRDVAQVAGVSPSTASRVLNAGGQGVSEALATRVRLVADSLGYVSNEAARALRGRRTAVVLLTSDPRTASIAAMTAGMEEAARQRGVVVSIAAVGTGVAHQVAALRTLRGLRPRALVIASASFSRNARDLLLPELETFRDEGGNVIFIGGHAFPFPAVRFDDLNSGRIMGRHMGGLGRSRPAILTTQDHPALEARAQGFLEGLSEVGVDPRDVVVEHCEVSREGGRAAALRLAERNWLPDLLLAGNDVLAIGALNGFRQAGIDVPQQVAVSGIDDIPLARDVSPPLTTVALPFHDAGHAALEMALATDPSENAHLPGTLVVRESTATDGQSAVRHAMHRRPAGV